jgi:hypothetical protein
MDPLQTLHVSIESVYDPPRLNFGPIKLLTFDFDAEPDPAFQSNADPDPACQSNADPDPLLY